MEQCELDKPLCKRKLMLQGGPFETKKNCPLSTSNECPLAPAKCPLAPESQSKNCPVSKIMKSDGKECPLVQSRCPCDPNPPCPLLFDEDENAEAKSLKKVCCPSTYPCLGNDPNKTGKIEMKQVPNPCSLLGSRKQEQLQQQEVKAKEESKQASLKKNGDLNAARLKKTGDLNAARLKKNGNLNAASLKKNGDLNAASLKKTGDLTGVSLKNGVLITASVPTTASLIKSGAVNKPTYKVVKKGINVPDCTLSSTRPLPCSECLGELLANPEKSPGCNLRDTDCPYLKILNRCDDDCDCKEVPRVDCGPPCPFAPEPCPCCATPKCPLTRIPDCPLEAKAKTCAKPSCKCKCQCPVVPPPCSLDIPPLCKVHKNPAFSKPARCTCINDDKKCPLIPSLSTTCPLQPTYQFQPCYDLKPPPCPPKTMVSVHPLIPTLLVPPEVLGFVEQTVQELSNNFCTCINPPSPQLVNLIPSNTVPMLGDIKPPCVSKGSQNDCPLECPCEPPRTFHVPTCVKKNPACLQEYPKAKNEGELVCPFYPRCCPLGRTCPYPVPAKAEQQDDVKKENPKMKDESTKQKDEVKKEGLKMKDESKKNNLIVDSQQNKISEPTLMVTEKPSSIQPPATTEGVKTVSKAEKVMRKGAKAGAEKSESPLTRCPLSNMPDGEKKPCPFAPRPCPLDPIKPLSIREPKPCPFACEPVCPLMPKPLCPPVPNCLMKPPLPPMPECPYAPPGCPLAPKKLCFQEPPVNYDCPCPPRPCCCPKSNSCCCCPPPTTCPCPDPDTGCACPKPLPCGCCPPPPCPCPKPDTSCLCPESDATSPCPCPKPKTGCPCPDPTPCPKPDSGCPKAKSNSKCPCSDENTPCPCSKLDTYCPCPDPSPTCPCPDPSPACPCPKPGSCPCPKPESGCRCPDPSPNGPGPDPNLSNPGPKPKTGCPCPDPIPCPKPDSGCPKAKSNSKCPCPDGNTPCPCPKLDTYCPCPDPTPTCPCPDPSPACPCPKPGCCPCPKQPPICACPDPPPCPLTDPGCPLASMMEPEQTFDSPSPDQATGCPCPEPDPESCCPCPKPPPCPCPKPPVCPLASLMSGSPARDSDNTCPCPKTDNGCPLANLNLCGPSPELDSGCPCPDPSPKLTNCPLAEKNSSCPDPNSDCPCPPTPKECPIALKPVCPLVPQVDPNCPMSVDSLKRGFMGDNGDNPHSVAQNSCCPCDQPVSKECVINMVIDKLKKIPKSLNNCPVKIPPCEKFPEGRCAMEDLGLCDCDYPIPPCMLPPQSSTAAEAPPQYCTDQDCCMGLPLPPTIDTEMTKTKDEKPMSFYQLMPTKPGKEETKYYVEILDHPPVEFPFGAPKERQNPNWFIVKYGTSYEKCEKEKEKARKRAPSSSAEAQYNVRDVPLDPETLLVMENRKYQERLAKGEQAANPS